MNAEARVAHVWRRLGFGPAPGDVEAGVAAGGAAATIDDLLSRPLTTAADWQWPTDHNPPVWDDVLQWIDRLWERWLHGGNAVQERIAWTLAGIDVVGFAGGYPELKEHHNRLHGWPASSYKALLTDIANTAPMQKYLTGIGSVPPHPNENLARELMELFSLGVTHPLTGEHNYAETDIKEVSRALTGYRWNGGTGAQSVRFDPAFWDGADKTFLGAPRGAAKLAKVVDAIAEHDSFKYFIPQRIYRELVGVDPSPSALGEMASVWGSDGNLRALVDHIAHRPEFLADDTIGNRVKSPVELLLSTFRVLGFANVSQFALSWTPSLLRQNPIDPPDVSGWDGAWLHPTYIVEWSKFTHRITWFDRGPGVTQNPTPAEQQSPTLRRLLTEASTSTATDMTLRAAGLYEVAATTRNAVDDYVHAGPWDFNRVRGTMQLVLDSPEFMVG